MLRFLKILSPLESWDSNGERFFLKLELSTSSYEPIFAGSNWEPQKKQLEPSKYPNWNQKTSQFWSFINKYSVFPIKVKVEYFICLTAYERIDQNVNQKSYETWAFDENLKKELWPKLILKTQHSWKGYNYIWAS